MLSDTHYGGMRPSPSRRDQKRVLIQAAIPMVRSTARPAREIRSPGLHSQGPEPGLARAISSRPVRNQRRIAHDLDNKPPKKRTGDEHILAGCARPVAGNWVIRTLRTGGRRPSTDQYESLLIISPPAGVARAYHAWKPTELLMK